MLCQENDCVVSFDENFVYVKDQTTGAFCFRDSISKQGVYPFQPTVLPTKSSIPAFLATKE